MLAQALGFEGARARPLGEAPPRWVVSETADKSFGEEVPGVVLVDVVRLLMVVRGKREMGQEKMLRK